MPNVAALEAAAADVCGRWSSRDGAGLAAAVIVDDATVWSAGFGSAAPPHGPPMAVDTICYVGSVAKQFTAAAVILAALDGDLQLTDRARRWVPELPAYCETICLDDLLHHTSGVRDYFGYRSLQGDFPDHDYDADALLADLNSQCRLNWAPGQRFGYSNTNYVLLSVVAERAMGVPFPELARSRLFEPLGMNDSSFRTRTRPSGDQVARAYDRSADGTWVENDLLLGVVGDGGMRSTVTDLVRWTTACMDGSLDPRLVQLLSERGRLATGHTLSYGRGIGHRVRGGRLSLQHGGGHGGWGAMVTWYPDDHVGVVVLANAGDVDPLRIALGVADPLLPGTKPHRARHPVSESLMGLWIDDDQGIVLDIAGDDSQSAVMAVWGNSVPLRGDGDGAAVADTLGLRLSLAGPGSDGRLLVEDNGDPWGTFRRADPSGAVDASAFAGRYRCAEFASPWDVVAENDDLRVAHLADDTFAPVLPGVYTSRATTLRFTAADAGGPRRMTVDTARTTGFSFVATD